MKRFRNMEFLNLNVFCFQILENNSFKFYPLPSINISKIQSIFQSLLHLCCPCKRNLSFMLIPKKKSEREATENCRYSIIFRTLQSPPTKTLPASLCLVLPSSLSAARGRRQGSTSRRRRGRRVVSTFAAHFRKYGKLIILIQLSVTPPSAPLTSPPAAAMLFTHNVANQRQYLKLTGLACATPLPSPLLGYSPGLPII